MRVVQYSCFFGPQMFVFVCRFVYIFKQVCAMPAASGDVLVYCDYKRSIPAGLIKGDKSG
jgi:hypothetical protein